MIIHELGIPFSTGRHDRHDLAQHLSDLSIAAQQFGFDAHNVPWL